MSENLSKKNGALPFETALGFTAIPTAVCMYYVKHPRFTPTTERLYRYLLQRHNSAFGYAFPSFSVIRREANIGSNETIGKSLESLEYLGLLRRGKHDNGGPWSNNVYYFVKPIEDEAEFMRRFGHEIKRK